MTTVEEVKAFTRYVRSLDPAKLSDSERLALRILYDDLMAVVADDFKPPEGV